jgi:hypothetical protein
LKKLLTNDQKCDILITERKKEVIKMKKINFRKIMAWVLGFISYFGMAGTGAFIAVGIEYGFDGYLTIGAILGVLVALCAGYSAHEQFENSRED